MLASFKLHADDTPVKVPAPEQGMARTGRLWVYVRDDHPAGSPAPPAAWYRHSPDRKGEHPAAQLKNFRGALQAEAYSGWIAMYDDDREGARIKKAACMDACPTALAGPVPEQRARRRQRGCRGAATHPRALLHRRRDQQEAD